MGNFPLAASLCHVGIPCRSSQGSQIFWDLLVGDVGREAVIIQDMKPQLSTCQLLKTLSLLCCMFSAFWKKGNERKRCKWEMGVKGRAIWQAVSC